MTAVGRGLQVAEDFFREGARGTGGEALSGSVKRETGSYILGKIADGEATIDELASRMGDSLGDTVRQAKDKAAEARTSVIASIGDRNDTTFEDATGLLEEAADLAAAERLVRAAQANAVDHAKVALSNVGAYKPEAPGVKFTLT